jgi:FkbH-like protein
MSAETKTLDDVLTRYRAARTLQQLSAAASEYAAAGLSLPPAAPKLRLALTGNYSTQFLAAGFPVALAAQGFAADIYESPYNQWRAELLDTGSPLHAFAPTHIVLALSSIELAYGSLRRPEAVVEAVDAAVKAALRANDAQFLITLPEPLIDEMSDAGSAYAWRREVTDGLRKAFTVPRVTLLDIAPLIRTIGAAGWFDDRFYDAAKLPFHPDRTPALLGLLANAVVGATAPRCKLVVVDLDDTLWGGRVGDDGCDGLQLDAAGKGRHFLRLQAFLAGLHAKGILLAIASKNDPAAAQEVFDKRPEMILRRQDFAAAEIHWEPKSSSLGRILERLQLSTAGVVFLDDNPVERAEVLRRFPDIAAPDLPDDPAQRVPVLERSGLFDHRLATDESRGRTRMYAENVAREAARYDAGDYQEFLRDLKMILQSAELKEARERVIELIHKTNQFNLTTRRYNWGELASAVRSGFGRCYRLTDRFGDNGIISVAAVARDSDQDARIDLWLMSCRVLGRKVEETIVADLAARVRALGARRLIGEYIASPKNALVRNLYPRLGFSEIDNDGVTIRYALSLTDTPATSATELIAMAEGPAPIAAIAG